MKMDVALAALACVPQSRHVPWKRQTQCAVQVVLERPGVPQVGPSVSTVWMLCNNRQSPLQWPAAAVAQERLHNGPFLHRRC